MLFLNFTEKQDLLLMLSVEITKLSKELSKLPEHSNLIDVNDKKQSYPALIERYNNLWKKINLIEII